MSVNPIPDGCHSVNCYLVVPNSEEALKFYAKALGATEIFRMPGPGGHGTMHAEMRIGDSAVMLTDENPAWGKKGAKALGGSPISMMLYVEDVDALIKQAGDAGCEVRMPPADMFWGDRFGQVVDPYGIEWGIATHVEDVAPEEMERRSAEFFKQMAEGGEPC